MTRPDEKTPTRRGDGRPTVRATVWTDLPPKGTEPAVDDIYPDGFEVALQEAIRVVAPTVTVASIDDVECGLSDHELASTDVLVWFSHRRQDDVPDEVAARVQAAVLRGLGLIVLHSGALSKPFRGLMGTTCTFRWREPGDSELVWVTDPGHPIAQGLPPVISLPVHEMYGEPFDIPAPDELVLISSFSGGEVFRSGCCFQRGAGRIFFFSPGHETNAVFTLPDVRQALANAVVWAARPEARRAEDPAPQHSPTGWFEASAGHATT